MGYQTRKCSSKLAAQISTRCKN